MRTRIILIAVIFLALTVSAGECRGVEKIYQNGIKFAREGNLDFAFMQFRTILRDYSTSKYREGALFAMGEYYFIINRYDKSSEYFNEYLETYPEARGTIFALAYLYKIVEHLQDDALASRLKRKIVFFRQVGFIFRDYIEYTYTTPFDRKFKARIRIDQIDFYLGGKIFEKITY